MQSSKGTIKNGKSGVLYLEIAPVIGTIHPIKRVRFNT